MNTKSTPQSLLQQIAQIQRMEPGKLCILRQGPKGPYYNLQCRENGKTVSPLRAPRASRGGGDAHRQLARFQELVGQYVTLGGRANPRRAGSGG